MKRNHALPFFFVVTLVTTAMASPTETDVSESNYDRLRQMFHDGKLPNLGIGTLEGRCFLGGQNQPYSDVTLTVSEGVLDTGPLAGARRGYNGYLTANGEYDMNQVSSPIGVDSSRQSLYMNWCKGNSCPYLGLKRSGQYLIGALGFGRDSYAYCYFY